MKYCHLPEKQGLYDPRFEHDSCGVGFVCNVNGQKSNSLIRKGIQVLKRLSHRGAVGADPETGDGAGILIQMPHDFLERVCVEYGIELPSPGNYGSGLIFLPPDKRERRLCKEIISDVIEGHGQKLLGWRKVPVDVNRIGETARRSKPVIEQVFIGRSPAVRKQAAFERRLYIIRKVIENRIRTSKLKQKFFFYITNLSSRTLIYKGLLMPDQLADFYLDLKDERLKSALCLVHSRYSTNTFPAWDLAQPFRFLAHNGEINTLRGNVNWMRAREGMLSSRLFREGIEDIKPIVVPGGSDSAAIDNAFELLTLAGRSMPHAMMMLIPGAWEKDGLMPGKVRKFYQYHAAFMEPWDGPAAITFTDGTRVGAVLDRNGLRPARYIVTREGMAVMASEAGVLDMDPSDIAVSGRLEPGKIFYIDTDEERIIDDSELKEEMAGRKPYGLWIRENMVDLDDLGAVTSPAEEDKDVLTSLKSFGYTREDLKIIIRPMAEKGSEPVGSMGNDTPHAVLSCKPKLLYDYFKQLFAQVTNPAIDPIREELVMSLESYIGSQKNILDESPGHCHKLRVKEPVLTNEELEKIRSIGVYGFRTRTISLLFRADSRKDFMGALDRICRDAESAVKNRKGYNFIILSDRGVRSGLAPLPALLAVGAVHHHLIRRALRTGAGIIVESGEPRDVHHFALLFGYGADCVNPYGAYDSLRYLITQGDLDRDYESAVCNYRKAVHKGILKILSKMGISTLNSYRGAQIFESLGLSDEVVDRCFTGTVSRIGGANFDVIAKESILRHKEAYPEKENLTAPYLSTGGIYQWKKDGEFHLWNPESIAALQDSARKGDYRKYKEFARLINDQSGQPTTLRSLLKFRKTEPVPIEDVEPVEGIVKRFAIGAMSFGSISRSVHEALAIAMNRIGARSNTGEGGEDPARFTPLPNGDSTRSAIKQVASGRFGVTTNYLVNADEIQIKIAQGAKPGEGGQLPGHKVSAVIARTRYTTAGVTLISPPPHHDIYSIEDLAQLIFDLRNANPGARISVKLVSEIGVGTVAAGVAKGHADMILISGGDGGTGASPRSSIRHTGLPWELGVSETHQTLVLNDLRSRVRIQTDGQMRTGRDVAVAALLGAEEFGFCTAALIVMGCVMLRHCNLNNCVVGIATQDSILEKRFRGRPEHIVNYFQFVARELREVMSSLGVRTINEMVGRTDLLEINREMIPWKAKGIDFSRILYKPEVPDNVGTHCLAIQDHGIDNILDRELVKKAGPALEKGRSVNISLEIRNDNRTTGTMLSGEVCRRYGEQGLPDDTIHCRFKGFAGQSFGAFLACGITLELEGIANDYVGKGLSGGRIIIYPGVDADYRSEKNIIIGNTTFYGATSGEAYIRGVAGERFCIRNSGINAVVEGVGDHGCEYMTGGRVVVIGVTGRNFAAGMSGGIAYVYDIDGMFRYRCNLGMVELETADDEDLAVIHALLHNHRKYTKSPLTGKILDNFHHEISKFIKVMPLEYKRIMESMRTSVEVSDG